MPAYMLSVLHRQALLLKEGFVERYPNEWLVWEPGPWQPARSSIESNLETTLRPSSKAAPQPATGDALCFQLKLARGAQTLKVGRATTNDIVINDLTASREQFMLRAERGAWFLAGGTGALELDGKPVGAVEGPLSSGAVISLGDVRMTLLSASELASRAATFRPKTG